MKGSRGWGSRNPVLTLGVPNSPLEDSAPGWEMELEGRDPGHPRSPARRCSSEEGPEISCL